MNEWFNWPLIANPYNWAVLLIVMLSVGIAGVFVANLLKQGS
jgi:hypothetical protein